MSKQSKKVEQLLREIEGSGLDPQHKSYAADVIGEVEATTNGTPDKIQAITEALLNMTGYMIRRDIFLHDTHQAQLRLIAQTVGKAVEDHENKCPMKVLRMTGGQAAAIVVALAGTAITAILKWG